MSVIAQVNDYAAPGDKRCIKFYDADEYNNASIKRPFVVGELVLVGTIGVSGLMLYTSGNVFDSRGEMIATLPYVTHPEIIRNAARMVVDDFDSKF